MTVSVDEARTLVEEAEAALGRLDTLPLGYTEREILAAVRGVLAVADAALSLAAAHEAPAPAAPVEEPAPAPIVDQTGAVVVPTPDSAPAS